MRSEELMGHIPSHYGSQPKTTTNGQTTTGPQISITRRDDGKYFIGFLLPSAWLHYCCRRGALRPREREKRGKFCKFCYIRHLNAERGPHPRTVECSTFLRSWSSSSTSRSRRCRWLDALEVVSHVSKSSFALTRTSSHVKYGWNSARGVSIYGNVAAHKRHVPLAYFTLPFFDIHIWPIFGPSNLNESECLLIKSTQNCRGSKCWSLGNCT